MINIEVIDSSNMGVFGRRLETFLNEHPDAKILFTALKGIEGGKGIFCILSYEKEDLPTPMNASEIAEDLIKVKELRLQKEAEAVKKAEAVAKRKATLAAKKAAKLKELAELEAEVEAATE